MDGKTSATVKIFWDNIIGARALGQLVTLAGIQVWCVAVPLVTRWTNQQLGPPPPIHVQFI